MVFLNYGWLLSTVATSNVVYNQIYIPVYFQYNLHLMIYDDTDL